MIRILVALPGRRGPRWVRDAVARARAVAEVAAVVVPPLPASRAGPLWRLWERLDLAVFGRRDRGALTEVDLLDGLPPGSADAEADLLLWLRPDPPPPPTHRYGTWSIEHEGDLTGGVLGKTTAAGSALRIALSSPPRVVHALRTDSALDPHSLFLTRRAALAKAAALPARGLERLAADGWESLLASARPAPEWDHAVPSTAETLAAGARAAARLVVAIHRRRRTREAWCLFLRRAQPDLPRRVGPPAFRELRPPRGEWYADPFLLERADGGADLFFERCPAEGKGVIAHLGVDPDGAIEGPPRTVLERAHHLSYPFVFRRDGEVWMIPETRAARAIELYRAEAFPHRWTRAATLVSDVEAVDATLHERGGRLYLFAAVAEPGASTRDELRVFHAEQLFGPWSPHPRNPVVSSVRSARPAGRLFERGDALYRPAQDNSATYGGAVVINRLDVLSPTDYREEPVARIEPAPELFGTHTWNACAGWEVADGLRRERA